MQQPGCAAVRLEPDGYGCTGNAEHAIPKEIQTKMVKNLNTIHQTLSSGSPTVCSFLMLCHPVIYTIVFGISPFHVEIDVI